VETPTGAAAVGSVPTAHNYICPATIEMHPFLILCEFKLRVNRKIAV